MTAFLVDYGYIIIQVSIFGILFMISMLVKVRQKSKNKKGGKTMEQVEIEFSVKTHIPSIMKVLIDDGKLTKVEVLLILAQSFKDELSIDLVDATTKVSDKVIITKED